MTTYKKVGRGSNLLKNPRAKHGLDHWEIIRSGGDGFDCEKIPKSSKPFLINSKSKDSLPCWATSYELDEKLQLVDLLKNGFKHGELDNEKPPITVRDWFIPRLDCDCVYTLNVRLLGNDKTTALVTWNFSDTKQAGADWEKVEHVFVKYPSGVRYVEFTHGGKDTNWWRGHFGAKMTDAGVFVGVASDTLIKNPCAELDSCWSTSHKNCQKKQLVDLCQHGIGAGFVYDVKPEIKISEWYRSRSDAVMVYWLTTSRLLDRRMQDKRESTNSEKATGKRSHVTEGVFKYPKGVGFIEYTHGGRDDCNWKGYFGPKMTYSSDIIGRSV